MFYWLSLDTFQLLRLFFILSTADTCIVERNILCKSNPRNNENISELLDEICSVDDSIHYVNQVTPRVDLLTAVYNSCLARA